MVSPVSASERLTVGALAEPGRERASGLLRGWPVSWRERVAERARELLAA